MELSTRLWTELADRGVIEVSGADAASFLQGLLSAEIEALASGQATLAALLTPQGKILFDGIVVRRESGFFIDCRRDLAADFAKRLGFYKLRAKVDVRDASGEFCVAAIWPGADAVPSGAFADPRDAKLGARAIVARGNLAQAASAWGKRATAADYHAHRIARAIPEGGIDYAHGDAFPHEADMDRLGGVSFTKGCYVGQEVVSRMQHRGSARTRIVPVAIEGAAEAGSDVTADGRRIGVLGSCAGGRGLAMLRLDKVRAARDAGTPLLAGAATLTVEQPDWTSFDVAAADPGGA